MSNCPRCLAIADGGMAYCGNCSRPQIAESLRSPVPEPVWLRPLQQTLLVVVSLWFLITFGVAFLREWKAIRDSRALLEQGEPQKAWNMLSPFLTEHPENKQALLLCGQATIRVPLQAEPKRCLDTLTQQSPELARQLGDDYRHVLTELSRKLPCGAENFAQLLTLANNLGNPYPASVFEGLDGVIETCRATQGGSYKLQQIGSFLDQSNQAATMVEKGYLPAISKALAQAKHGEARILAQQAKRIAPDKSEAVETVIDSERRKVSASFATLRGLCDSLKSDPRYHPAGSWCFPAGAPPAIQTAKDGWGKPYLYTPFKAGGAQECNSGFAISSYGPGSPTQEETREIAITCRLMSGYESWQTPNRFWLERGGD